MVRYAGNSGNLDYRVTASHHEDEGFDDVNDNKSLNSISVRAVYDATPGDNIDVQFGLTPCRAAWGQSPVSLRRTGTRIPKVISSIPVGNTRWVG